MEGVLPAMGALQVPPPTCWIGAFSTQRRGHVAGYGGAAGRPHRMDVSALSVWAVAEAQKTLAVGLRWLPAVLLGTIAAVGGGAIRDLLLARTPSIFGGTPLYATVAIVVRV